MKRDDRQRAIMDLLVAESEVDLDSLSDRFQVSRMTIHRDLDDLETAGPLRKIRGGATIRSGTSSKAISGSANARTARPRPPWPRPRSVAWNRA